jgi:hypothetical protein
MALKIEMENMLDQIQKFDDISSEEELIESTNIDDENFVGTVYDYRKSKSSFLLDEVTGIIYGGFSFRFWMFRKYINQLKKVDYSNHLKVPFFAW